MYGMGVSLRESAEVYGDVTREFRPLERYVCTNSDVMDQSQATEMVFVSADIPCVRTAIQHDLLTPESDKVLIETAVVSPTGTLHDKEVKAELNKNCGPCIFYTPTTTIRLLIPNRLRSA